MKDSTDIGGYENQPFNGPNFATGQLEGGVFSSEAASGWISGLNAPIALLLDSGDGPRFVNASAGFLHALECSRAEITGRRLEDLLSAETHIPLGHAVRRVMEGIGSVEVTARVRFPSRRAALTSFKLRLVQDRAVIVEVVPPGERRDGAVVWRRVLFEHLNLMGAGTACIYDRAPSVSLDLAALLGFPEHALAPKGDLIHPADAAAFLKHQRNLLSAHEGQTARVTTRMRHRDGGWRWIEVREQVLERAPTGEVGQVLGFAIDVTEHYDLIEAANRMAVAVLDAETEERRRIARELHDSMAQHLVVIDLAMSRLQRGPVPLDAEAVRDIQQALRSAHGEVRSLSYLLHPPDLERFGLVRAVEKFGTGFGNRTNLLVEFEAGDLPRLASAAELTLFRIAQEALMNVHRHARASKVRVSLAVVGNRVELNVSDDGVGSGRESEGSGAWDRAGVGLSGMRARIEQFSGSVEILPTCKGFHVRASLPVIV